MGRQSSITKPFEQDELEQLARASSKLADQRPTSKLSRDEILGLISRAERAPTHDGLNDASAVPPTPPPADIPGIQDIQDIQAGPAVQPPVEPAVETHVEPAVEPVIEPPIDAHVAAPVEEVRRPLAPRSRLSLVFSLALLVAVVIVTLLIAV